MGRKGVGVDDDARWVFNRIAGAYRWRPGYPVALVDRVAELAGGPEAAVVDLGAGTGHLALALAARRLAVTAVEPARAMLAELAERAREALVNVGTVHASAEQTGLGAAAFDLAVIADAAHWIEPQAAGAEIARLVAPGGRLAVVEVEIERTPFVEAMVVLAREANPKAFPERRRSSADRLTHLFAAAGARRRQHESFVDAVVLDDGALAGLLGTLSFVGPALGPVALSDLAARAREVAAAQGGALWPRRFELVYARIGGGRGR